ncbi:MAG TPA: YciI family protein [Actinomycetota bacterium]|nr:YciI family protein [Actinomycetota bacterium]
MTQYMLTVHSVEGNAPREGDELQRAYQEVDALNGEMQAKGVWVFGGGLHPPSSATVVRVQEGEVLMTDGPFVEGKEHVGGFWVIEAPDLDAALAWAAKATAACMEPVEVRPFQSE